MHDEALAAFWVVLTFAFFISIFWARAELGRRKAENRLWSMLNDQRQLPRNGTDEVPAVSAGARRVELLESQVDHLSQQIDRLVETQEFLSRVLTDRIDHLPDPRLRTPH